MKLTSAALLTARSGSQSVLNKNILPVRGKPLCQWNLEYAKAAARIDDVFCLTDCPVTSTIATDCQCRVLALPTELANGNHYGAIRYGLAQIEATLGRPVDLLVILLGNSAGAVSHDLDGAIEALAMDPSLDSVCSVSEFNAFNPLRAMALSPTGQLTRTVPADVVASMMTGSQNEKNCMGGVYFFNGSFWVCRREAVLANSGALAFPWLGDRVTAWVQGPFMEVDAPWQLEYLSQSNVIANGALPPRPRFQPE